MKSFYRYLPVLFLCIPVTWAGSFIAGKFIIADMPPMDSVFWRFILSAGVMLPFLFFLHRSAHPTFGDRLYLKHLTIVVLTSGISYHIFFFWALKYTSPTNTALIIALNPFFTAFAEIIFFKKPRPVRFYFGFMLAFLGAVWVNIARGDGLSLPGFGELLCLLSSLSWTVYTILAKLTKKDEWDSLWIGAYNYLFTALIVLLFIPQTLELNTVLSIKKSVWVALLYMAIFPTAIGYTLYYIGVQIKGPAWAATYIYLVPSFTANLDYLFFKAEFTFPMVVGTTLVVLGLLLGNLNARQLKVVMRLNKHKNQV